MLLPRHSNQHEIVVIGSAAAAAAAGDDDGDGGGDGDDEFGQNRGNFHLVEKKMIYQS